MYCSSGRCIWDGGPQQIDTGGANLILLSSVGATGMAYSSGHRRRSGLQVVVYGVQGGPLSESISVPKHPRDGRFQRCAGGRGKLALKAPPVRERVPIVGSVFDCGEGSKGDDIWRLGTRRRFQEAGLLLLFLRGEGWYCGSTTGF